MELSFSSPTDGRPTAAELVDELIVLPGELITSETGYLRGHGTFEKDGRLYANVAGIVEKINQWITVRPLKARFSGEVGDVVVGRIIGVEEKRWSVDIGSSHNGILQLSAITLPGGVQRRRTFLDQLHMREFFAEDDLISAEVQAVHHDGALALHTRNLKYGKLANGQLVVVPNTLVKRIKQHFVTLDCGVDVVLGRNGFIWITTARNRKEIGFEDGISSDSLAEEIEKARQIHAQRDFSLDEREAIARVANAIKILSQGFVGIFPETISDVLNAASAIGLDCAHQMLDPAAFTKLVAPARERALKEDYGSRPASTSAMPPRPPPSTQLPPMSMDMEPAERMTDLPISEATAKRLSEMVAKITDL